MTGGADPFPEPTVGLVLPYGFLWSDQHDAGATEARKHARPCAITIVRPRPNDAPLVWVSPFTTRTPDTPDDAIELPPDVKRRLGLDDRQSWIITTELNRFTWPGFDLRRTPSGAWVCGKLPREVVQELRERIAEHQRRERLRQVDRDD